MAFGVTAALTFLFLLGLYCLSQVVAVLRTKHTADLAILPEEALAAGIRLGSTLPRNRRERMSAIIRAMTLNLRMWFSRTIKSLS